MLLLAGGPSIASTTLLRTTSKMGPELGYAPMKNGETALLRAVSKIQNMGCCDEASQYACD